MIFLLFIVSSWEKIPLKDKRFLGVSPFRKALSGWAIVAEHCWCILGDSEWIILDAHYWYSLGAQTWIILDERTWLILTRLMRTLGDGDVEGNPPHPGPPPQGEGGGAAVLLPGCGKRV